MRRIDDTYRVLGLVAVAVTAGLSVAGFANGTADAHGEARLPRHESSYASEPAATVPARNVRVVYGGVIGGRQFTATNSSVSESPPSAMGRPAARRAEDPAVTGSVAQPGTPPVRLAAREEGPSRSDGSMPHPERVSPGSLNLNVASIGQLDGLGGGRIGKAIARSRPYASPDDLLRKRVLSRATYARIKDQVTVE